MNSNKILKRLIAFAMAIVMIVSLVVIDGAHGIFAKTPDKTISVSDIFDDVDGEVYNGTTAIDYEDLYDEYVKVDKNDVVGFSGDKYSLKYVDLDEVATMGDALQGITPAADFQCDAFEKDETRTILVLRNKNQSGTKKEIVGILKVTSDNTAPVIDEIKTASTTGNKKVTIDGKTTYILAKGKKLKLNVSVSDGTKSSGLDCVNYYKEGNEDDEDYEDIEDGVAQITLSENGTYHFYAEDNAGNASEEQTVSVKLAEGIKVNSITTTAIPTEVKVGNTIIAGKAAFEITVEASEKADGYDVPLTLTISKKIGSEEKTEVNTVDFDEQGKATFTIPEAFIDNTDDKNILYMQVSDGIGGSSPAYDANGYIIFVDGSDPEISISKIKLTQGGVASEYTKAEYDALEDSEKWAQAVNADISVSEAGSYVEKAEIVLKNPSENESTLDNNDDVKAFSYTKNINLTKDENASEDGAYEVAVNATNYAAGEAEGEYTFYIDNTAPEFDATSKLKGKVNFDVEKFNRVIYTNGSSDEVTVNATDATSGIKKITYSVYAVNMDFTRETTPIVDGVEIENGGTIKMEDDGWYDLDITVTDNAGNSVTKTVPYNVNNKEVEASLTATLKKDGETVKTITSPSTESIYTNCDEIDISFETERIYLSTNQVEFEGYVTKIDGSKEDINVTATPTCEPASNGSKVYKYSISYTLDKNQLIDGVYTISYTVKPEYGYSTLNKKIVFTYDSKAPVLLDTKYVNPKSSIKGDDGKTTYFYTKNPVLSVNIKDDYNITKCVVKDSDGNVLKTVNCGSENYYSGNIELTTLTKNKLYNLVISVVDKAGNEKDYPIDNPCVIDTEKPTVTIADTTDKKLNTYWNNTDVTISATAKDKFAVVKIVAEGKRDGKKLDAKTVEVTGIKTSADAKFTYKTEGVYEIKVTAYDACGNASVVAETSFVIDKTAPKLTIKGIPENKKTQGTTVKFSVEDEYGMSTSDATITKYYVTYDGEEGEKAVKISSKSGSVLEYSTSSTCNELETENGTKAVKYYFTYEIKDKAGNVTKGTTDKFYVDSTAPKITVKPVPSQTNDGYYDEYVDFKFYVKEQFELTHSIEITDENGIYDDESESFKETSYSYDIVAADEGIYKMKAIVTDAFGNSATKIVKFTIDKKAPKIEIGKVNATNNTSVSPNIILTDVYRGGKYNINIVRKDPNGKVISNIDKKGLWQGTSSDPMKEYKPDLTLDEEGDYEITVTATDKAGNKAKSKPTSFRIDKTAPVLSITGVSDVQSTAVTATMSVEEAFALTSAERNAEITATITRKTDSTGETNVKSLTTSDFSGGNPHTTTYSFNEDGIYTITFDATDASGNKAAQVTKTFKVDTTAPVVKVTAVDKDNKTVSSYAAIGSDNAEQPNFVDMSLQVEESFFKTNKVNINVTRDGKDDSANYFQGYANRAELSSTTQRFEEDGVYKISINSVDEVGNESETYDLVFTVDNTAPTVENTKKQSDLVSKGTSTKDGALLLNAEDFADIKDKGYEALWDVNDTSVFTADVKMDGVDFVDFSDLADGYHEMVLTVTDEVGHVTTKTFAFMYDGTAPRIIISGVENGEVKDDPFDMVISLEDEDDIITNIEINGTKIDPSEYESTMTYTYHVKEYQKYEVKVEAKDISGNVSSTVDEATGEIFNFRLGEKLSLWLIILLIALVLALAAAGVIVAKKKKSK